MQTNIFSKIKETIIRKFSRKRKVKKPKHYVEKDISNIATSYTTASPAYYQQFVNKEKSQDKKQS